MSLVGSLEDLGLGDILQIISLSRKSGVLVLRADHGEAQIVFSEGGISTACTTGGPATLRELLAKRGGVTGGDLEGAAQASRNEGRGLDEVLLERGLVSADDLDAMRRDHVESTVLGMFAWATGEFSFEISDVPSEVAGDLAVSPGINPQFLALEGTRFRDEQGRGAEADAASPSAGALPEDAAAGEVGGLDLDAAFAPHDAAVGSQPVPAAESRPEATPESRRELETELLTAEPGDEPEAEVVAEALEADPVPVVESLAPSPEPAATPAPAATTPVVGLDGDLACLEWIKEALEDVAPQVHIFQRSDHAMNRIRQYLARAERPLVLLAADAPADPLSGARDAGEIVERLKAQAARMQILMLVERGQQDLATLPQGNDGVAVKPNATDLADPRCVQERELLAGRLRERVADLAPDRACPERIPEQTEGI